MQHRLTMEVLVSAISAGFINVQPAELEAAFQRALQALGALAGVDRSYLLLVAPETQAITQIYEWRSAGTRPLAGSLVGLTLTRFGWMWERLKRGELFWAPRPEDAAPVPAAEWQSWRRQMADLQQLLAIPLLVDNVLIGMFGLNLERPPANKDWSEEDLRLLKLVSEIFASVLARQRSEAALRESRDELEKRVAARTAELRDANQRMRQLARQVVRAQEEERQRVARELHDETGQILTGLKLSLETGQRLPPEGMKASLLGALSQVSDLMQRVRSLSLDLRPAVLDDLGLLPTLLWHIGLYSARTSVQVNLEQAGLERRFAPEIETAVYRLVQEALTNVARHSGAGQATVRLWCDEDRLNVQVEDHGIGFDTEAVLGKSLSFGLTGMRERMLSLNGHLTVESVVGKGTRLTAEIPLAALAASEEERSQDDDFDLARG